MDTLGEKIYNIRLKNNLSQDVLADQLGVSRQTVIQWECNRQIPRSDKIQKLCDIFGVTSDYFFSDIEEGHQTKECHSAQETQTQESQPQESQTQETQAQECHTFEEYNSVQECQAQDVTGSTEKVEPPQAISSDLKKCDKNSTKKISKKIKIVLAVFISLFVIIVGVCVLAAIAQPPHNGFGQATSVTFNFDAVSILCIIATVLGICVLGVIVAILIKKFGKKK
jgi:transcriptional regulator with XRE-family HTH domain